ncbi:MAG: mandelate racemase [Chromatiales bacterium]|jgi:D-arabinonate dehydratase|nr:mandelate racemase [Chromatiales bacterium]
MPGDRPLNQSYSKDTPADSPATINRRRLITSGIGLVGAAIPLMANAGAHSAAMPIVAPPIPKPGADALVIESIELFWLHDGTKMGAAFPRLFVRIYTKEGVVGEAYTFFWHSWDKVIEIIRDGIEPLLIGMDALQIEACWQRAWYVLDREFGRGTGNSVLPQFTRALAAVDNALWDAVGKAYGAPCYKMWGAHTNVLPAISFDQRYRHPGANYDAKKFGAHMRELVDMGFGGVKLKPGRPPFTPEEDAEWVHIVRDAVGPDFLLQADANQRWNVDQAIDFGRRVQDVGLRWLEEPCRRRIDMARVRSATGLPICAGQSEITIDGARYLMTDNAIDICNYDPGYACGPTAWRKVYGLAQSFGVEMSVHQQPQMAAHLMAATPDGVKHGVEVYLPDMDPLFWQMIENQNKVKNGMYVLPEGPGYGYVYDEKIVAKYRHKV